MNHRFVMYTTGKLLQVLAVVMVIPAVIAFAEIWPQPAWRIVRDAGVLGFIIAIVLSLFVGTILVVVPNRNMRGNTIREGFAVVTFGWILLALFGCIPFFVYFVMHAPSSGAGIVFRCFTDAFFEIMSGFTTTGATILADIEIVPRGLLFWRSLTHWLGGMGIVTLAMVIFPAFGVTAYQMFRGEVPGPTKERLKPRLAQTATILWGVYALLTFIEVFFLCLAGMSIFDSFCHSFGTMATGGFSTRNISIAAWDSALIEWIIIVFMVFAGMNFMIHYRVIFSGRTDLLRTNREFRFYLIVICSGIFLTAAVLWVQGIGSRDEIARSFRNQPLTEESLRDKMEEEAERIRTPHSIIRHSVFQVVSMTTTTGYCTADFDVWPGVVRLGLVILMFFGGCAGSTGGGIKMIRIMVVLKAAWREVRTMIQPRYIVPLKVANNVLEEQQVKNIIGFFVLFLVLSVIFSIIMSFFVPDFTTALCSVVSTMCNIGPGLSGVGAMENYAWIALPGKWVLTACMLLGRLEIYTVLIAFSPISWRR